MHFIDQDLSGLNQLGAIVGAISGYLCGKQFGQLCLTVDWQIICDEEKVCEWEISQQCIKIMSGGGGGASFIPTYIAFF